MWVVEMARRGRVDAVHVWAVHVTDSDPDGQHSLGPIEVVFTSEDRALDEATERSRNALVVAASVTRYRLDLVGSRSRVAVFVDGRRQRLPHFADDHTYVIG